VQKCIRIGIHGARDIYIGRQGRITVGEEPIDVQPGDALYVAPDIIHGYEIQETACEIHLRHSKTRLVSMEVL